MGLLGGIARTAVVAGTWAAISNRVSRFQSGRWASQDQSGEQHSHMPPPPGRYQRPMFQPPPRVQAQAQVAPQQSTSAVQPTPAHDMDATLAQLQQLGALRAQGVLTDAEFEDQKRKILR